MVGLRAFLDNTEGTTVVENVNMLLAYLSFGIGPFIGALKHMLLLSSIDLRVTMATGIGEGVSFVVAAWKPLQMLLDGKMNIFKIFFLLCAGAFLHFLLRKYVEAKSKTSSKIEIVLPGASGELSPKARRACLASFVIWFYTFVEGLAMGVAATSGFYFYLLFPMALHGLPRGVGVGSIVYGATGSRKGSCLAVALTCLASPIGSISAVLTGVGPNQCWSGIII
ncbi:hypothetical protein KC19_VG139000 [Ceratodon purpureus]|uniref:Uncharacterized protein n=1 Tax=Ceratodon purpureus TaxID=3225 RepID=A0A8T0HQH2_CERPU|nr:hypothetical protein KC19_VG139000 [Ceratodon purpureus]